MVWGIMERKNKNPGHAKEEKLTPVSPFPLYFYSTFLAQGLSFCTQMTHQPQNCLLS